jgi:pimeloyl-ACP methyl ester carboxylesterase
MSTILFLSGFGAPAIASKSWLFFDEKSWKMKTIFYKSKTPTSPAMVENEIENLADLVAQDDTHVVGHSLGAWWAANLACRSYSKINKMVLWTPLGLAGVFPFFRAARHQEPFNGTPNKHNLGLDKTLVVCAKYDLIVPYVAHALPLIDKFKAESLFLTGGHLYQIDHAKGLSTMKQWLGVE